MTVDCYICKKVIRKYKMDTANVILVNDKWICSDCSYEICKQKIEGVEYQ